MSPAIVELAERLAGSHVRYASDQSLAGFGKGLGLRLDDCRRAAILADRMRRHRQEEEGKAEAVPVDAPIVLLSKTDKRRGTPTW